MVIAFFFGICLSLFFPIFYNTFNFVFNPTSHNWTCFEICARFCIADTFENFVRILWINFAMHSKFVYDHNYKKCSQCYKPGTCHKCQQLRNVTKCSKCKTTFCMECDMMRVVFDLWNDLDQIFDPVVEQNTPTTYFA